MIGHTYNTHSTLDSREDLERRRRRPPIPIPLFSSSRSEKKTSHENLHHHCHTNHHHHGLPPKKQNDALFFDSKISFLSCRLKKNCPSSWTWFTRLTRDAYYEACMHACMHAPSHNWRSISYLHVYTLLFDSSSTYDNKQAKLARYLVSRCIAV